MKHFLELAFAHPNYNTDNADEGLPIIHDGQIHLGTQLRGLGRTQAIAEMAIEADKFDIEGAEPFVVVVVNSINAMVEMEDRFKSILGAESNIWIEIPSVANALLNYMDVLHNALDKSANTRPIQRKVVLLSNGVPEYALEPFWNSRVIAQKAAFLPPRYREEKPAASSIHIETPVTAAATYSMSDLSAQSIQAIMIAQSEAREASASVISTAHLLIALFILAGRKDDVCADLRNVTYGAAGALTLEALRSVRGYHPTVAETPPEMPFTGELKDVFQKSATNKAAFAANYKVSDYVLPEELLLAIVGSPMCVGYSLLQNLSVDIDALYCATMRTLADMSTS